jgi:hypothetical protein
MSEREDIGRLLGEILSKRGGGGHNTSKPTESMGKQSEKLMAAFESFNDQFKPSVGDLITIKDGMHMWKSAVKDTVLVITEVVENPRFGIEMDGGDEKSVGTSYAALKYDIVAGYLDNDVLITHFYDSRRFKKYNGAKANIINVFGGK